MSKKKRRQQREGKLHTVLASWFNGFSWCMMLHLCIQNTTTGWRSGYWGKELLTQQLTGSSTQTQPCDNAMSMGKIRQNTGKLKEFETNVIYRVPTQTGKPGKMGRHFPVREKSGNFEQTGKVRENHTKYWKTQGIWDKYYLIFLVIFKWTMYYLLKWIKFSVKKINH